MAWSEPWDTRFTKGGNQVRTNHGKIEPFQYTPAQMFWHDIRLLICDEDQLVQSPIGKRLSLKLDAVSWFLHWCQIDVPQQKCYCVGIDIKHGDALPLLTNCDLCQVETQHQCPSAEAFRAESLLTAIGTIRDPWNKIVAHQLIPK